MISKKYRTTLIVCFIFFKAIAQPGILDKTFNTADPGFWKDNGFNNTGVYDCALQNDGKLVVVGGFTFYNGTKVNRIARINENGSLDNSFNSGTAADGVIQKVALQNDGKIIIKGNFHFYNGIASNGIARLNSDGTFDHTFNTGIGLNDVSITIRSDLYIQNDGKILISGYFTSYNGKDINRIARLNSDGSLDTTFKVGKGASGIFSSIIQQKDDKILLGSINAYNTYNGIPVKGIIRLNADGGVDSTFVPNEKIVSCIVQLKNDKILITSGGLKLLNTDGSVDTTFKPVSLSGDGFDIKIQNDGKIILAGDIKSYAVPDLKGLVRLNEDGTLDPAFDLAKFSTVINTVAIQSNGQLCIGGSFSYCKGESRDNIARINADGTLDKAIFNVTGMGLHGYVSCSALQSDGKIMIGGEFDRYNGKSCRNVARLNTDGSLDTTFNAGTGFNGWVENMAIQTDGKILFGGYFTSYNGIKKYGVVRLNIDGSIDQGFANVLDSLSDGFVETILLQADKKIILGGYWYLKGKFTMVMRLNEDGTLDTTFGNYVSPTTYPTVFDGAIQADGKIIVGGMINSYNGMVTNNIIRLNRNGTLDTAFHLPEIKPYVSALDLQKDEKVILSGPFTSIDGVPCGGLGRLNNDGTLDKMFNSGGIGFSNRRRAENITVQKDDKILLTGSFSSYNGKASANLARLNPDGSIDSTFNVGTGTDLPVYTSVVQDDGKIIIGGSFCEYNGEGKNGVARLNGDTPSAVGENKSIEKYIIYPNPNSGQFYIQSKEKTDILITDAWGRIVYADKLTSQEKLIDLSKEKNGIYFLQMSNGNIQRSAKIIISK